MAAQGEIDVFGKLVSQTTNGVLAGANQIHDPNMNKMQSVINAEVQVSLGGKADVALAKKAIKLAKAGL